MTSEWNDFQKKTSGLGLSNEEKSDLYRKFIDGEIDYQGINLIFGRRSKNPRSKSPQRKSPRGKSPTRLRSKSPRSGVTRRRSPRSKSPTRLRSRSRGSKSPTRLRSRSSSSGSPPYIRITKILKYEDLNLNSKKDLIYLYKNGLVSRNYIFYSAISKNYQDLIEKMLKDKAVSVEDDDYKALVVALNTGSYKLVDILLKSLTPEQLKSREIIKVMLKLMSTNPGDPRDPKNHNYEQKNLWKYAAAGLAGLLIGSALL